MTGGGAEIEKSNEDDTSIWRILHRTCCKPNTVFI